jgi:Fe-S-cluster containining protein
MDSALRPYFTREEIQAAISAGVPADAFPDHAGSKISVVRDAQNGDGFKCPAFDSATGGCGIYDSRPLDCRLYPVAVMWDRQHVGVVAGWDTKCPFIVDKLDMPESHAYLGRILTMLESQEMTRTFVANPQLIGAFQDDVMVLRPLERITEGLRAVRSDPTFVGPAPVPWIRKTDSDPLFAETPFHPLTLADRGWFEQLLLANRVEDHPLAAYSFSYHFIWRELFTYEWARFEGHTCLFATNPEGTFLALPPLGPDPCGSAMAKAFALMNQRNRTPGVARIENLPEPHVGRCRELDWAVCPMGGDYLYRRTDLVQLQGDRYKSQRAAYNHCAKHSAPVIRPYTTVDLEACLAVYGRWQEGITTDASSNFACHMAADAASAHRTALRYADNLGLAGLVADVQGTLAAYTVGYPLNDSVFCIILEIADRTIAGLSQYIFREFCRRLVAFEFINVMGDSGLVGLRRAKQSYHPIRVIESYIVASSS